jgi:hypothetical protein
MSTLTPYALTSCLKDLLKPAIANLELEYTVRTPEPTRPAIEDILTILPLLRSKRGMNPLIKAMCDIKLVLTRVNIVSKSMFSNVSLWLTPPLLIKMSNF